MPFQKSSGDNGTELPRNSNVFNIATPFIFDKVFEPLKELDKLEKVAMYGTYDIDDFNIPEQIKPQRRIDAIKRIRTTLLMVIKTSRFVMKQKDKDLVDSYIKTLEELEPMYSLIARLEKLKLNFPEVLIINEKQFNEILNILLNIKMNINEPINRAGLIFQQMDDLNLDEIRKRFTEGG